MKNSKINLFLPTKAASHRQKKVAAEIKIILSNIFLKNDLPVVFDKDDNQIKLSVPVTITEVDMSPDMSHAHVFVIPLGGEGKEEVLLFLKHASWYIRKTMAKQIKTRIVPDLTFHIDQGFDRTLKMDELFDKIKTQ
jgi:ribosome-binding factor A